VHADDNPEGGCGTSPFCRTCGAAVAIVTSQEGNAPAEAECLLTARVNEHEEAFEFKVRAAPIEMKGQELAVVSLLDIRDQKRKEALEAVFLHDIMNTATALNSALGHLARSNEPERGEVLQEAAALSQRLMAEIAEQQELAQLEAGRYQARRVCVSTPELRQLMEHFFARHDAARNKTLAFRPDSADALLYTDPVLLRRALTNLVKNALEATPEGGEVRLWWQADDDSVAFHVWNAGAMRDDVALRVFQRYFTTKGERGRGLGTYGAKLIAERYLGGRVSFTTSEADGTAFRLELPLGAPGRA
jgi:signal transduction histidine kinase